MAIFQNIPISPLMYIPPGAQSFHPLTHLTHLPIHSFNFSMTTINTHMPHFPHLIPLIHKFPFPTNPLPKLPAWHDGAEVSASGWRSGGPRFKSRPRLISQSWSSYQLNQLGSKAASDSTLKQLTLAAGYQILVLYFTNLSNFNPTTFTESLKSTITFSLFKTIWTRRFPLSFWNSASMKFAQIP